MLSRYSVGKPTKNMFTDSEGVADNSSHKTFIAANSPTVIFGFLFAGEFFALTISFSLFLLAAKGASVKEST